MVKKERYNLCEPTASVFSIIEEIIDFSVITRTSYTQNQAINISYFIIHKTGKFSLSNREWNHMRTIQKAWIGFKQFFRTAHHELQETKYLTVQDEFIQHTNRVHNVVAGLQEFLQQYPETFKAPVAIQELQVDHVENDIHDNKHQLYDNLQQMQTIMQVI